MNSDHLAEKLDCWSLNRMCLFSVHRQPKTDGCLEAVELDAAFGDADGLASPARTGLPGPTGTGDYFPVTAIIGLLILRWAKASNLKEGISLQATRGRRICVQEISLRWAGLLNDKRKGISSCPGFHEPSGALASCHTVSL